MDHGTDRDVALQLMSALNDCAGFLHSIRDTKYSPHILTQPSDVENATLNASVTFTVVANNVKSYQWQYKQPGGTTWQNTTISGYATDTITVNATAARDGMSFRCIVTGIDDTTVTSDAATLSLAST